MRKLRAVLLAAMLATVAWSSTEAMAATTNAPVAAAPTRPDNTKCLSASRIAAVKAGAPPGYTLDEARRCAPEALLINGPVSKAGRYIVPAKGGYGIMGISAVSSNTSTLRDAFAYNCGDWIGWHINSWYQDATIYMTFDTDNHVSYCNYAHNDYENPGGSVSGGTVTSQSMGVINQNGWQVNPWLDWVITWGYPWGGQSWMYCRHYLDGNTGWSGWCHG